MNNELYSTLFLKKSLTLINTENETEKITLYPYDYVGLRTVKQNDGGILYTAYKIENYKCYCSTYKIKNNRTTLNAGSGLESQEILEDKLYFKYKRNHNAN